MGIDGTYILVIIALLISLLVQFNMNRTFQKYSRIRGASGLTGAQTAEQILRNAGIYHVRVEHIRGNLNDHYDPRSKVLSSRIRFTTAHLLRRWEWLLTSAGHAIQDAIGYAPLKIRSALVPAAISVPSFPGRSLFSA